MTNTDTTAALAAAPAWATRYTALALAELPADITTATPAQVDEVIRTVQLDLLSLDGQIDRAMDTLRLTVGQTRERHTTGRGRDRETVTTWTGGSFADAVAAARATPGTYAQCYLPGGITTYGDALTAVETLVEQHRAATDVEQAGHDEYTRREGWTRFYRVNNSNGHVHATRACRETYVTTQWTWPTQLSGGTAQTVVEAAGGLSCLTCFPEVRGSILEDRDIDPTAFETPELREAREAREQEKADKLAAKIAKGVTADGTPLAVRFDGRTNEVKTEKAAELRYVDCAWDEIRVGHNLSNHLNRADEYNAAYADRLRGEIAEYAAAAETLAKALAWKRSTTVAAIRDQLAARVAKRVARGY